MPIQFKKRLLLSLAESVYGQDAAPVAGANAVETVDLQITPIDGDLVQHNVDRADFGNYLQTLVNERVRLEYKIGLASSGAAGTGVPYADHLACCAYAETINDGVDAQYDLVDPANADSCTKYFYMDGALHKVLGCRGEHKIAVDKGIPYHVFSIEGLYVGPIAAAFPTGIVLTAYKEPLPVSNANTTFTLHGFAAVLHSLELARNNKVVARDLPGDKSIQITDRLPGGKVVIDAPALGTKDFFAIARARTLGSLQLVHGTVAGSICQLDETSNVQLIKPAYSNQDDVAGLSMDLSITDSSFKMTFK